MSGTITTINTPLNGAAGSNGTGGDAPAVSESAPPFSNEDFTTLGSPLELFPSVNGGLGGGGADGGQSADGVATTVSNTDLNGDVVNSTTWTPGKGGLPGGQAGLGGDATLTMADDSVGTSTNTYASSLTIDASTKGGQGGTGGTGGTGGDGGSAGSNFNYVENNGDGTTTTNISAGAAGGSGGAGGYGGNAGSAASEVSGLTSFTEGGATVTVAALGGLGGDTLEMSGGSGASGGDASAGGDGGNGGNGGNATAKMAASTMLDHDAISVSLVASAGAGGAGGNGGPGGDAVYSSPLSPPFDTYDYGTNGNGGDGGDGGSATATLTGNSLTAPTVTVSLSAEGNLGGTGGIGGTEGTSHATPTMVYQVSAPGASGTAGTSGDASLIFTDNTITVGSPAIVDFPGELTLGLSVINPTGELAYFPLNGAAGGNLQFSGNDLVGAGASQLDLQLSGTGTAVVNTLNNTLSIDGSPANAMTGFTDFDIDNNDTFDVGPGVYQVHYASDADTLVYTPQSNDATLQGITSSNLVLDFEGFGSSLTLNDVQDDTTTSGGNEFIRIPSAGTIELLGFTGAIPDGDIVFNVLCFRAGTQIATPTGEVPIENLRAGEMVLAHLANGQISPRPIIWIGHRSVDCRRHPKPKLVWPVLIRANAFGRGQPLRNLFLSPDHAVFINDVLIPVKYLINDHTITQVPVTSVEYFHVELPTHAVLLANGLSVESYLDVGDRSNFSNGGRPVELYPDFSSRVWDAKGCAPLVAAGPQLNAVRLWLNAEAADKSRTSAPPRRRRKPARAA